jgi:cobalamin synthase
LAHVLRPACQISTVIEVWADRLLRRKVVIPTVILFVLALPLGGPLRWISDLGVVALFLLFSLWLAKRFVGRVGGTTGRPR